MSSYKHGDVANLQIRILCRRDLISIYISSFHLIMLSVTSFIERPATSRLGNDRSGTILSPFAHTVAEFVLRK